MGSITQHNIRPGEKSKTRNSGKPGSRKARRGNSDPVIREWNMYMNNSPDVHLILLRYPETQEKSPYAEATQNKPIEFRIKPISGLIEVDIPIDPNADSFDKIKGIKYGEALRKSKIMSERGGSYGIAGGFGLGGSTIKYRQEAAAGRAAGVDPDQDELLEDYDEAIKSGHVMRTMTLGGHISVRNQTSPNLYVGHFDQASVFFTKVEAVCVLRPQLLHLDAYNDQRKTAIRLQSGTDTIENEVIHLNMTIKKSEGDIGDSVGDTSEVAKLLKSMREEPWQRLSWIDSENPEAYQVFNAALTPSDNFQEKQLTCNMTNEQWLDAISCPRIDPINPDKKSTRRMEGDDILSSTDTDGDEEVHGENDVMEIIDESGTEKGD